MHSVSHTANVFNKLLSEHKSFKVRKKTHGSEYGHFKFISRINRIQKFLVAIKEYNRTENNQF